MVQRKVLEKLSDSELEKYVKAESRFVPEAIQYAFDILKERGKIFSENETEQIQSLIKSKFENEPKFEQIKNNGWDRNFTENENAIELYYLLWHRAIKTTSEKQKKTFPKNIIGNAGTKAFY